MNKKSLLLVAILSLVLFTGFASTSALAHGAANSNLDAVIEAQMYNRAIHIMAMLLIGFGFLMVFVRGYGLSAVTATYMMVAVAIPGYFVIRGFGWFGHAPSGIEGLILTEFAAASLLICAGAVLGRLKIWQYMLMGLLFLPAYMVNEWILLDGGWGLINHGAFVDTGGSIVIHAFGALFGLGVAVSMTTGKDQDLPVATDFTSDRFSLLGSMVLWVFWPSFCGALVAPELIPATVMNVVFALCGSTILTYFSTVLLRKSIDAADIANATLAGGVAIGSTCDKVSLPVAFAIGAVAGFASTFGFAVIQDKLQKGFRLVDTCGVSNLHGIPGLLGGLAAFVCVTGIDKGAQGLGIAITIGIALVAGLIAGKILSFTGHRSNSYQDSEEFIGE